MRRALLVVLLGASACRLEPPEPVAPDTGGAVAPDTEAPPGALPATRDTLVVVQVAPSGLVLPVVGVRPEDLVDTFTDARSEGRVHDALDILAERGTPVVAAAAGTVAQLFESDHGGLTVYVLDGQTVYYYAHLDAYTPGLAAGQAVVAGQRLGSVGSTGNASPEAPHLHFAIWRAPSAEAFWDGEPVNPYALLAAPR